MENNQAKSDNNSELTNEFLYSIWNFFAANLSDRARKNYYNIVKAYVKVTDHTPDELTHSDADKYFNDLVGKMNSGKLSRSTAIMRLSVMKSLCDYIKHRKNMAGQVYTNFFRDYAIPDNQKILSEDAIPTEEEINYLFEKGKKNNDDTFVCILSLVVKCGLTTSEICRITIDSIMTEKKGILCIKIRESKKVSRIIKLPSDVSKIMKKYLKKHDNITVCVDSTPKYIFYNKRGTNLKPRDAERILKNYVDQGIYDNVIKKKLTLQSLRHAAIKYMLMGKLSEDEVAAYCGITSKWLPRYERVVSEGNYITSADYSVISIKTT